MENISIIGGGIGGLTLAIALQQRGIAARIYEAAPELRPVGAGLWVPSNALQVLARLGLVDQVERAGALLDGGEMRDERAGTLQVADFRDVKDRYGYGTVAIHRARLHAVLEAALAPDTLQLGRQCVSLTQMADHVLLRFDDGVEERAGIVIGADGVRSVVRRWLFPEAQLRYSGQSSYRAVLQYELPKALDRAGWEVWGAGCRFGLSRIGHGDVYWYATFDTPPGGTDTPDEALARCRTLFAGFPAPIGELIAATVPEQVLRTDMYDLRPLPAWSRGRVALLGDAAHAMTPNLGQGGAQAIEDAYVLAQALAASAMPEAAFTAYEHTRRPKAEQVANQSWQLGRIVHIRNPIARALRNMALRSVPESVGRRQFDALYTLNY